MSSVTPDAVRRCPGCEQPIDPLRAPAVSVVEGKIVHFCSVSCREAFLDRAPKPTQKPAEEPVVDTEQPLPEPEEETEATEIAEVIPEAADDAENTSGLSEIYRSKLLLPQWIQLGIRLAGLAATAAVPASLGAWAPALAAAPFIVGTALWTGFRERRLGFRKILESLIIPFGAAVAVVGGILSNAPRMSAISALAVLCIEAAAHLMESLGRHRSGVLRALDESESAGISSAWRDNSQSAEFVRKLTMGLEWARIPLSLAVAFAVYAAVPGDWARVSAAFAAAVTALNPRTLRMATGDAHLTAALRAAAIGAHIRDADAVERAALSQTILFEAESTLFLPERRISDWQMADGADPATALDAVMSLEAEAPGSIAAGLRNFASERKARAATELEIVERPGLGIEGETPWGYAVCGARSLLLEHGISTGRLETKAAEIEAAGRRAVFAAVDGQCTAVFAVENRPVGGAAAAIQALQHQRAEIAMVTSAEAAPAHALSDRLGLDTVFFETPKEKLGEVLRRIVETGSTVFLVGRGPAFEEHFRSAHAAAALGGEAGETQAGFNALGCRLNVIPRLFTIAKRAQRSVRTNLAFGFTSAALGMGLAIAGAAPSVYPTAALLSFSAAAACTFNGPFPALTAPFARVAFRLRNLRK